MPILFFSPRSGAALTMAGLLTAGAWGGARAMPGALFFSAPAVSPAEKSGTGSTAGSGQKSRSGRKRRLPVAPPAPPPARDDPPSGADLSDVNVFDSGYAGEPIDVDLDAAPIFQFLEYFSEQFGFSFVLDKSVKEVEPISVRARRQPWNRLVATTLQARGLVIRRDGTLYRILTAEAEAAEAEAVEKRRRAAEAATPLETRIYRLRYRNIRTGGYLRSGGQSGTGGAPGGAPAAGNIAAVTVGTTATGGGAAGEASPPPGLISGFRAILVNQLTKDGTIEEDPAANLLIIRDTAAVHERIAQLLRDLDQPERQIEIEARILIARRDFARQLGALINAGVNSRGAAGQGGTALNPISGANGAPLVPGGQPSEILGLGSAAGGVLGFAIQRGTYALSAALSALESNGIAQTVLAPRLVVLNNTAANIGNGVDIPYVQAGPVPGIPGQPGGGVGAIGVAQVTQLVNASLGFSVTPQILGDGEEILLSIEIRNDAPSGATPQGQPIIQRQNVTTAVRCPNGGALVLSGLLSDREDNTVRAVPGLRKIPLFGKLFQRDERNRTQFELLFFVTARVVQEASPTPIIERPEGIAVPNQPEYGAPKLPNLEAPPRLRPAEHPTRETAPRVTTPNVSPGPKPSGPNGD